MVCLTLKKTLQSNKLYLYLSPTSENYQLKQMPMKNKLNKINYNILIYFQDF